MAYTKVNFADGTTPLDATSMGKLDDALADQDTRISDNADSISDCAKSIIIRISQTMDDLLSAISGMQNYTVATISILSADVVSTLTGGVTTSSSKGYIYKNSDTLFDYLISVYRGASIFTGRIENGTITYIYRYNGTAV